VKNRLRLFLKLENASLIQGNKSVIEAKIVKFWIFLLKIIVLGVILCEKSIPCIPEASKCILDHQFFKVMPRVHFDASGMAESISRIK
jgi:hypothetical protein